MLKSMSMFNFIHFRDRQELKFEEGANFIIGANSTGKTACLELIRRCFSYKVNKTTSSIPNKQELAYAVCHFKVPNDELDDVSDLIASLFVKEDKNSSDENQAKKGCMNCKVLCTIGREGTSFAYVQKSAGWYGCLTSDFKETSYSRIELGKHFPPVDNIITRGETENPEYEKELFYKIQKSTTTQDHSVSEYMDTIYKWLEKRYVGVMPMRSIGPTQWTRSKNYQSDQNYEIACQRAEILNELLTSDMKDRNLEEMYHKNLTFPFKFTKEENTFYVENERKNEERFPLLKCPDGILEAKQLILILTHKEFSTITLEEPDRGMHPHMIKKMRDLILRKITGKTILIITHNPSIINPWSMSRSFIFSKTDNISHNVRKFPKKGCKKYGRIEEMKCLLFSPRVLFVEGITDKIVFEAIFTYLTTNEKSPIAHDQVLKDYLLATEVMELQSASKGQEKMEINDELMKESLVFYDFDQFTNHYKSKSPNKIRVCGGKVNVDFDKDYNNIEDFLTNGFDEFEKACEDSKVFCWRTGDLEDQIMEILKDLKEDVRRRIAGEPTNKNQKKTIKDNIRYANLEDIDEVAKALVEGLEDVKTRFINFLKKMAKIDMPTTSETCCKRKALNEMVNVQQVDKRQKSDDSDQMSVECTEDNTDFQRRELQHSGVSESIDQMSMGD